MNNDGVKTRRLIYKSETILFLFRGHPHAIVRKYADRAFDRPGKLCRLRDGRASHRNNALKRHDVDGCVDNTVEATLILAVADYTSTVTRTGQSQEFLAGDDVWQVSNNNLGVQQNFTVKQAVGTVFDNVTSLEWQDTVASQLTQSPKRSPTAMTWCWRDLGLMSGRCLPSKSCGDSE